MESNQVPGQSPLGAATENEPINLDPAAPPLLTPAQPTDAVPRETPVIAAPPDPQVLADQYTAAMQQNVQAQRSSGNLTSVPEGAGFRPRSVVAAEASERRNRGTQVFLPATQTLAVIRDLPFTDYTMLSGIPAELREQIDASIRNKDVQEVARTGQMQTESLSRAVDMFSHAEKMANAVCIAAFIKPRLVMRESELVPGDEFVWLVTDVELDDRLAVLNWISRNRQQDAQANGGATAVAGFPG